MVYAWWIGHKSHHNGKEIESLPRRSPLAVEQRRVGSSEFLAGICAISRLHSSNHPFDIWVGIYCGYLNIRIIPGVDTKYLISKCLTD